MKNKILLITILFCSINLFSQNLNDSWQIGIGMGVTKFNESDVAFIGDQYLFQTPVISITMPIGERLSIDGAMSFNTINDIGVISNSVNYFSMDGSLRYNFNAVLDKFSPYVFVGASIVDSERKMTPTANIGAGGIYWLTDKIGINPQIYYKHSLESYESMRSHIQGTLGLVFKLNWNNAGSVNRGGNSSSCYYNQF
ncbi:outer membrane beta-barrel protein [Tenacibaculum sp. AHE15PA]|uniref:outer membrane beta-barrel protein n=1 Tax=Tenacibaculum TaxID=104267 RepID=UPI001C4FF5D1|nr:MULTISPECIES: outer membrane beta-barrel protein [Tenacibaculum]QXP73117.1 outer membrane beta-barrel protein [Tenacibaculum sp. AHE14PA]QXP77031.1 outer membrane beta-barrel protein [Tenacibaculum sp. AHE15PA]